MALWNLPFAVSTSSKELNHSCKNFKTYITTKEQVQRKLILRARCVDCNQQRWSWLLFAGDFNCKCATSHHAEKRVQEQHADQLGAIHIWGGGNDPHHSFFTFSLGQGFLNSNSLLNSIQNNIAHNSFFWACISQWLFTPQRFAHVKMKRVQLKFPETISYHAVLFNAKAEWCPEIGIMPTLQNMHKERHARTLRNKPLWILTCFSSAKFWSRETVQRKVLSFPHCLRACIFLSISYTQKAQKVENDSDPREDSYMYEGDPQSLVRR